MAAVQFDVVAVVVDIDQLAQHVVAFDDLAALQLDPLLAELLGRADAVYARNRRHDEHVPPLDQRAHRLETQPVNLLVELDFLFDIGVGTGLVGFGLVVVVIADEVLDGVVGEIALEFAVELRRQGLVVRDDQGRPLQFLDDAGHGKGFAAAGHPQQSLELLPGLDARDQLFYRPRLVAGGLVVGYQLKTRHHPLLRKAAHQV